MNRRISLHECPPAPIAQSKDLFPRNATAPSVHHRAMPSGFAWSVAAISTYAACLMLVTEIEEWTASPHPLAWHLHLRYPHCLHHPRRRRMRD